MSPYSKSRRTTISSSSIVIGALTNVFSATKHPKMTIIETKWAEAQRADGNDPTALAGDAEMSHKTGMKVNIRSGD
jgi:hypothetical protein